MFCLLALSLALICLKHSQCHVMLSVWQCACVQKYKQLVSEGRFQETLLEMYRWGKQHAWDPMAITPLL